MGQSCMKGVNVQKTPKMLLHCKMCKNPILDLSSHKCSVRGLQENRPCLIKSSAQLQINQKSLIQFYGGGVFQAKGEMFNLKIFKNNQNTQTQWIKQNTWFFPVNMRQMSVEVIKKRSFQEKLYWFRLNIERLRVSWENGAQKIKVDRSNILMSSKNQLQKINLRKQAKIVFTDQTVDDAGGLLRQYMHLALKQIFAPETGIFEMSQSKQLSYRFKWDQNLVDEYVIQNMKVLGLIIGKALFERISINCYLDRTILRQIAGKAVNIQDVFSFDQNIYKSLIQILNSLGSSQIALNFCIYHKNSNNQLVPYELIPDGQNIFVKDTNKEHYATLLIHRYCTINCKKYLQVMRQNIYKVVPFQLLSVFQPIQLEMMLHGPTVVDVQDWKNFTQYKGYKANDKVIKWYWEYVQSLDQQKLRNLLHYATGTTRVPILGFKYLQSNRNQLVRFTIQRQEYDEANPYPKSYTCFNRIHLPVYKTKVQMFQKLNHITEKQLTHFGLD